VWYKNIGTTVFYFVTNHAFDRETDGQADRFLVVRAGIPSKAVKTGSIFTLKGSGYQMEQCIGKLKQMYMRLSQAYTPPEFSAA